jgi:hypothetical protein
MEPWFYHEKAWLRTALKAAPLRTQVLSSTMITRRQLGLLGAAGLLTPRHLLASPTADMRRFLFVFCEGGWDTNHVFTPMLTSSIAHIEEGAVEAEVGGIRFVDHPDRSAVRTFFENHADRTCVINGIEIRSVAHERCRQLVLTGRGDAGADDWPAILAAHSPESLTMPHLVLDGPSFSANYGSHVVRVGDQGQLQALLEREALVDSDLNVVIPSPLANELEDAFLASRLSALSKSAGRGVESALIEGYLETVQRHQQLLDLGGQLSFVLDDLGCERDLVSDAGLAFDCFELGLSRCAMIRHQGWCSEGWDTHQNHGLQSTNFHDIFHFLSGILGDLDGRTTPAGSPLRDVLTLVVFSEMGRAPALNSWKGKDHWTFTSMMLIGAGVAGGQVIGGLDDKGFGHPVDLASGETSGGGVALTGSSIGATLLALGDIDPGDHQVDANPLEAALS